MAVLGQTKKTNEGIPRDVYTRLGLCGSVTRKRGFKSEPRTWRAGDEDGNGRFVESAITDSGISCKNVLSLLGYISLHFVVQRISVLLGGRLRSMAPKRLNLSSQDFVPP